MRIPALPIIAGLLISLAGCGGQKIDVTAITVQDVTTVTVSLNESPKFSRIIALANGSAEIIDAMGLKKNLVGRDIASTDPSLESVPIVTSGHQVVAEKILALKPDLVIIDDAVGPMQAITAIKSAGIDVVSIKEVWSVAAITSKVEAVATAIGAPKSGAALSRKITASLLQLSQNRIGSPRIAFLYLRGGNSIYLLGGKGSGADSLISAIGGTDVGAKISSTPFTALTSESFAEQNPEILLVMSKGLESVGGVAGLVALPGIAQTDAGKNQRVISVDDSLLLSFGPRTPSLLALMANAVSSSASEVAR